MRLTRAAGAGLAAAFGLLTGACEHAAPFAPGPYAPGGPYAGGPAVRLTFNPGYDRSPRWLPDGSGILYSFQRLDRPDRDRCLGVLPARGGARLLTLCPVTIAADDSTDAFEFAAPEPDGGLAYVRAASRIGAVAPDWGAVVLGSVADPNAARVLRTVPYTAPTGRAHGAVSGLAWLDASSLVYLGELLAYPRPCSSCARDTLRSGIEIVRLVFNRQAATLLTVPGTTYASSVAVADSNTIYFTHGGDSRIYRQTLSTGATTVAYDFGFAGVARDVDVRGNTLVAVVGGQVGFRYDSVLADSVQDDLGGALWVVDLGTGAAAPVGAGPLWFRRPSLDPGGRRVAAEGYALTFVPLPGGFVDTVVARVPDIWLVEVP